MSTPDQTALAHPITEEDIANYLVHTPEFFARHADLLATVQFTSPHSQRAVSLQERQAEMLREKIKLLEYRLMEMIRNGNDNVLLSDKVLRWAGQLLMGGVARELPTRIEEQICQQFAVPQVALRMWGAAAEYANESFAAGVSDDAKLFANSLTEPFCGLNTGFEATSWLGDPKAATSLALIPLRNGAPSATTPAFGLLVLASGDAQRFASGMGTDFLARIGELVSAALSRLR